MPIRIWNTPGGPVRYGEDWTDKYDLLDEEERKRLGLEQTPLGKWVSKEEIGYGTSGPGEDWGDSMRGAALDMTRPGNRSAFDRIMSRRSGGEALRGVDIDSLELDPLAREASRLSTPWRGTETMELEPALADRLGARWSGKASPKPVTVSYESEAMPTSSELEQSAALWKASQRPLATRAGEADIESTLAGAERERGLGQLYGAQAEAMREPQAKAPMTFQEFVIKAAPVFKGMALDQDELINLLRQLYEQQYGVVAEEPRRGAFGPGGNGTGFEDELDRRYGG